MKKILPIFLFSLISLILSPLVNAQDFNWNKYPTEVLHQGSSGKWDSSIHTAAVIYKDNLFKMWYGGWDGTKGRIGYAWSTNRINWEKHPTYVLDVTGDEKQVASPTVIYDEGKYKMWFLSAPSQEILYAESIDGINNWERKTVTGLSEETYWEGSYGPGTVIKIGDIYYLWYTAVGNDGIWKIGIATSNNGLNWTKYQNNPIMSPTETWEYGHVTNPSVVKDGDSYFFWYHSGGGYNISFSKSTSPFGPIIKPQELNPAFWRGGPGSSFDVAKVERPSVIKLNGVFHMWYSGHDGNKWSIGYATTGEFPSNLNPVILIPGMFASWNSKAILEGEDPPREEWITTPFINDYQGIIDTLKAAGYSDDPNNPHQNLFIFNYDWRDRVEDNALLLNKFIEDTVKIKNPNQSPYLVGHSLGGLIGRAYLQNYGNGKINSLITLGTPHSGAIQTYKAWEGGEIENSNPLEKLAFEIILGVNRNGFRTNKDVIREMTPVVHDLLPIFDFLKNSSSQIISTNLLSQKNTWLKDLETNFPAFYDSFDSIYGETGLTPEWYKVKEANTIEHLLGLWQDGKPTETVTTAFGDEVVLSNSATRSADPATLIKEANHQNLVTSKESISELLKLLKIDTQQIITPSPQPLLPSLFFAVRSPAKFTVAGPLGSFESDNNGLIFIPQATNGYYTIRVTGTNSGRYHLLIGQLNDDKEGIWKEIINRTAENKVDEYKIFYDSFSPLVEPLLDQDGLTHLNNALQIVEELKEQYPHWALSLSLQSIKNAQQQLKNKKYKNASLSIQKSILSLFTFRKRQNLAKSLNLSFSAIEDLVFSYEQIQKQGQAKTEKIKLQAEINATSGIKEGALIKLKISGSGNELLAKSYDLGEKMLNQAKDNFNKGDYYKAEIEIFVSRLLFQEIF